MNLLVIGGTVFLGRHLVDAALANGDTVTIFTRGLHNADLFPGVEKLTGDRRSDVSALLGRGWDGVVDTCGYFPADVRRTSELLADSVGHYTFISSLSVYSDNDTINLDETGAVGRLEDPEQETEITPDNYGPLKACCEEEAARAMPGRTSSVRAGLIVGPWDPSDRFTYWPHRIARGGAVLAPGRPERPVQFIDVRDLAEWALDITRRRVGGVFNATGYDRTVTMGELLETCRDVAGSDADLVWMEESFLKEQDVGAWMEMPLWIPEGEGMDGFNTTSSARAIGQGLRFRPIEETVRATLDWDATLPADRLFRAGMAPDREAALLHAYGARSSSGR